MGARSYKHLRVAIVGCGRIAYELENDPLRYKPCTHLGALRYWKGRDKKLEFIGFCDISPERAVRAGAYMRADNAIITMDFRDILAASPDLLVITSSTDSHYAILQAALAKGISRIISEKPVAFSAKESKQLRASVKKSTSIILPNYERRYHPKYLNLRKRIHNEKRSHSYRAFFAAGGASLYANARGQDEGVLLHDTTHLLDLVQFMFGKIKRFQISAGDRKHVLFLEHENGSIGTLETSLRIGVFHLELEVHLKNERIIMGNGFTSREKITASPHYKNLKGYSAPERISDAPLLVTSNPFVQLYREALYGRPTNEHFFEALQNIEILTAR
jgi:predicted dehydrogenase